MEISCKHSLFLLMQLFILCLICFMAKVEPSNKKLSALYVFGDSTVDPGNNNFINTFFRSNFPPYGRDLANQVPTGRFTNGKLVTDFVASYIGFKEFLPPYLDPKLSDMELITGVSFASAGSGFDPLTPSLSNVIPIPKQLEHFKECRKRLEGVLGKKKADLHIQTALFIISGGTNDFVVNYLTLPIRRRSFTLSTYKRFLLQHVKEFIQNLWAEGARNFAVVGLPPMGCLPIMITLNSDNAVLERGCIEKYSSVARDHNIVLQQELQLMHLNLSNSAAKIHYIDIYEPLAEMIQAHESFGFDEVGRGCCGSGYIEGSFLCNGLSYVCPDPSKYVFWDSMHPTEKAYHNLFLALRSTVDAITNG